MKRALIFLLLAAASLCSTGHVGGQILAPIFFAPGHHSTCNLSTNTQTVQFSPNFMTSDTTPAPFTASASTEWGGGTTPAYASFTGNTSNFWRSNATPAWIQIDLGSGNSQILYSYSLTSGDTTARTAKDWTMQGSNDGAAFTTLDTQAGITWASVPLAKTFTIGTPGIAYRYYRVNVTANNSGGGDALIVISVITLNTQIANQFAPKNMTTNSLPTPFVASAGSTFSGFFPFSAFDGNVNSTWPSNATTSDTLTIDLGLGNTCKLSTYTIAVFVGDRTRAPKNFKMQGSNDGSTFADLDTETNITAWPAILTFNASGSTQYRYFRLNVTAVQTSGTIIQIGEIYLTN